MHACMPACLMSIAAQPTPWPEEPLEAGAGNCRMVGKKKHEPESLRVCLACSGAAKSAEEAEHVCEALCRSGVVLCANNVVYLKPQEVAEIIMRARTHPLPAHTHSPAAHFSCADAILRTVTHLPACRLMRTDALCMPSLTDRAMEKMCMARRQCG